MPVELATFAMAIDARGMKTGGDVAEKELRDVDVAAKQVDRSLKDTEKSTGFVGRGFVALAGHVKAVVGAYAGYATVRKFAEELAGVDRALAGLEARTGLSSSSAEFRELADAAEDLALSSEFGVTESIAGLESLRRSGFTTAESIREIGSVAAYAEQSQKSLAATARDVGDEIRIFGLEAKDTGRFVDVMTVAARRGRTEVPELDAALRGVAASANEAGLSFEDTVSLLAQLTAQGVPASDAASKLEQVLQRVAKAAGVDGVAGALRELDRSEFRAPLFVAALERGIADLAEFKEGLLGIEGAAKKFDDTLDNTIGGRLSEIGSATDALLAKFEKGGGGGTTDFLTSVRDTIRGVSKAIDLIDAGQEGVRTDFQSGTIQHTVPEWLARRNEAFDKWLPISEIESRERAFKNLGDEISEASKGLKQFDESAFFEQSTAEIIRFQEEIDAIYDLPHGGAFPLSALEDELDSRRALIGLTDEQRDIEETLAVARKAAADEYGYGTAAAADALAQFEARLRSIAGLEEAAAKNAEELANQTERVSDPFGGVRGAYGSLVERRRLAGMEPEEADIQRQLAAMRGVVEKAYGENAEAAARVNAELEEQLRLTVEIESEAKKSAERAKEIGQAIGTPIKSALNDAAMSAFMGEDIDWTALGQQAGAQIAVGLIDAILISPLVDTIASALGGVINGLIEAATEALAQQAAAQGILSLLLLEKGGIVSNGDVEPFAYGGIVNTPTLFPLRRGKLGLMGEAGPEAIMPLARGSDGNLGVRSFGGGTTINVYTPDADSFRKSEPHIIADMKRRERRYA